MRSADLKLLARLLPELYSTQSNYHYLAVWVLSFQLYGTCKFLQIGTIPQQLHVVQGCALAAPGLHSRLAFVIRWLEIEKTRKT